MNILDNDYLKQACGIDMLTGEACRLDMRLICDFDEHGKELIIQFFGLAYDTKFQDSWNSTFTAGSIMLSRETIAQLKIFNALVFDKANIVVELKREWPISFTDETHKDSIEFDMYCAWMAMQRKEDNVVRTYTMPSNIGPAIGGNMTHAITGRTQ